jgi:hypothetical protein
MKANVIILITVLLSCLVASCNLKDETNGKCGASAIGLIQKYQYMMMEDSVRFDMQYHYDDVNKLTRVTFFSDLYDSICTDEHVNVIIELDIDTSGSKIVPKVRADWYPLFGSEITLTSHPSGKLIHYFGSYQIGLKQTWGDGPGMYYITWSFTFPSQTSKQNDLIWLNNRIMDLSISGDYYWFRR